MQNSPAPEAGTAPFWDLASAKWILLAAWGVLATWLHFFSGGLPDFGGGYAGLSKWTMAALAEMDPFSWAGLRGALAREAGWLLALCAMLLLVWGAGGVPGRWAFKGKLPGWALRLSLGLVLIGAIYHGLGLVGLWYAPVFAGISAGFALLAGLWRPRLNWREGLEGMRRLPAAAWLSLSLLAILFLVSRLPWPAVDSYIYHWAAPEHYYHFHKIHATPYCRAWSLPLFVEMLFAPALAFFGQDGAKTVNFVFIVVILGLIFEFGRVSGGRRALWWGAWLFLGGYLVDAILTGKNDLGAGLFGFLVVLAMMRCSLGGSDAWCLMAGIFGGALVATKIIGASLLVGAFFAMWLIRREIPWGKVGLALFCGAAVGLPWYVQLWFFTGNPLMPLVTPFFSNPWWGPEEMQGAFQAYRVWASSDHLLKTAGAAGLWQVLNGSYALLLLAPLALAFPVPREGDGRERSAKFLKIALLFAWLAWALVRPNPRYLTPLLPLTAVLAVPAIGALSGKAARILVVAAILHAASFLTALLPALERPYALPYLLGQITREDYESRMFSSHHAVRAWVNANLGDAEGIWLTGEDRRFGYLPRVVSQFYVDQRITWKWTKECATARDVRKKAKQWGISHVLYNVITATYRAAMWYEGRYWTDRQLELYRDFIARYARIVHRSPQYDLDNGLYYVWKLEEKPLARPGEIWFLPGAEGVVSPLGAPWVGAERKPSFNEYLLWARHVARRMGDVCYAREGLASVLQSGNLTFEAVRIMDEITLGGYEGDGTSGNLARLRLMSGRPDEGIEAALRAIKNSPHAETKLLLANAYIIKAMRLNRKGAAAKAGEYIDQGEILVRMAPETRNAEVVYLSLGLALANQGRYDDARVYAEKAWKAGMRSSSLMQLLRVLGSRHSPQIF